MIVICTFFFSPKVRGIELISADARQLFTPQLRPQNFFPILRQGLTAFQTGKDLF